jgi:hypothetical protein
LAARACKNGLLDDFEELYWKIVLFISFYLPAGVHAAFGLQPPIFARCMYFKALLLRE